MVPLALGSVLRAGRRRSAGFTGSLRERHLILAPLAAVNVVHGLAVLKVAPVESGQRVSDDGAGSLARRRVMTSSTPRIFAETI